MIWNDGEPPKVVGISSRVVCSHTSFITSESKNHELLFLDNINGNGSANPERLHNAANRQHANASVEDQA
jgi:hypothetical protein